MNVILLCVIAMFIFLMVPYTIYVLFIKLPSSLPSSQGQSLPTHGHGNLPQAAQWQPLYLWVGPILDFTHSAAYNVRTYTRIPSAVLQHIFGRFPTHNPSRYAEAGGGLYGLSRGIEAAEGFPDMPPGDYSPNMQPVGYPHDLPSPPQAAHTAS
ncbi:hypothetical protein C8F04DRAFT_1064382 [Mycena alexandri]|uniref:Uncharacterized protein n=1 Tax=Mycena alexandri TaxID=1745969 RepID=A0AAD6XIP4_9AGAR|nr:hypothetical protein C8F04DRAFT_1064382 [Mycena alexandri]